MTTPHRVGSGGWSSEGVQVISNETIGELTTVQCSSTHLASFAVLLDVSGGLEVNYLTYAQLILVIIYSCVGCSKGGKAGIASGVLHWLHYIKHLSLNHCGLLLGHGVR